MKNVLYIIKVVALACAAGVIMTILGGFSASVVPV